MVFNWSSMVFNRKYYENTNISLARKRNFAIWRVQKLEWPNIPMTTWLPIFSFPTWLAVLRDPQNCPRLDSWAARFVGWIVVTWKTPAHLLFSYTLEVSWPNNYDPKDIMGMLKTCSGTKPIKWGVWLPELASPETEGNRNTGRRLVPSRSSEACDCRN